jgi:peptidoglycan hydrolase CwlO-like protein
MQLKLKNAKNDVDEKLKDDIASLEEEITQLNNELDRIIKENTSLTEKLRSTQNEMISNSYANEEVITLRQENSVLTRKIQHLEENNTKNHSKDSHLNKKI